MKKIILPIFVLVAITGCQSNVDKLDSICNKMQDVSKMTDDCDKMANALEPVYADYIQLLDKLVQTTPDEATRIQITDTNSLCLKSILEISTGVCGTDPKIRAIRTSE